MNFVTAQDQILLPSSFPKGLRGLVFDIDGVLFDSKSSNMVFYNSIRRAVGLSELSPDEEDYCQMVSANEALSAVIPPELFDAALKACNNINYQEEILPMLSLEPGLIEMLHWLRQFQVPCAIFTNRSSSVDELLHFFSLETFFSPVKTAGNTRPKPYPDGLLEILEQWRLEPGQIAFLGDSQVDALAAEAAHVPFWAFRNNDLRADLHVSGFFNLIASITPLVEG